MITVVVLLLTGLSCLGALFAPWIGVVAYYALALGQPQGFWPEAFGDSRSSLLITAATLLGLGIATATRQVQYQRLYNPQTLLVLLLVLWVNLSAHFTSFSTNVEQLSVFSSDFVLETFNKIMLFYFIAILVIDDSKKLHYLLYLLAAITLYYTYWGNKIYLTGEFWRFGDNGRLNGPTGNYQDENYLGMVFVLGTPVLYYLGVVSKNVIARYGLWLVIPLSWHGLFLTGSRGGLLALGVVCIYIFFRSYNKMASIVLVLGLVLAIVYQSGNLLTRVDSTIEESESIQAQEALDPRLISWGVGLEIIKDYPVFGVGVGNFENAFPNYSNTQVHVAHNTFFQFSSNSGLLTGIIYLSFFWKRFRNFLSKIRLARPEDRIAQKNYIDDMINCEFLGFFVIAVFLDLMIYEFLYFFLLLAFAKSLLDQSELKQNTLEKNSDSIYAKSDQRSIYRV